jgi:ABC-2 type transport system ATP-binding protein
VEGAISAHRVSKTFGHTAALRSVSFNIPRGAVYALVGENGAGKTTLIKLMMNILRPTAGQITVLGTDSHDLAGKSFCQIGYVSENQQMADWTTVGGMLEYFRGFYPQWDHELERRLIRQFDLPLKRKLKHLSRGMRMKAAFVSSLAYRPSAIILDEPLSGLDPFVRDELVQALRDEARESTIFLSSHDLAEIEAFATHVGFLEQGRMIFSEEMSVLMERFREVTMTLAEPLPQNWTPPADWLNAEISPQELRFIHKNHQGEIGAEQVRSHLPAAAEIRIEPMRLRLIFLAMAKAAKANRLELEGESSEEGTAA